MSFFPGKPWRHDLNCFSSLACYFMPNPYRKKCLKLTLHPDILPDVENFLRNREKFGHKVRCSEGSLNLSKI